MRLTAAVFTLAVVFLLIVPASVGISVSVGPVEAKVAFEGEQDCAVGDQSLCVISWSRGEDPAPGDDRIDVQQSVKYVRASVHTTSVVPPQELVVDPSKVTVHHPVWRAAKPLWLQANDTLPPPAKQVVTLELARYSLLLFVHLPAPLKNPINKRNDVHVPIPWDCRVVFTEYANWDDACNQNRVRPLPNGVNSTDNTDRMWDVALWIASCDYGYRIFAPQACPLLDAGQTLGSGAAAAWRQLAPDIRSGAELKRVIARVGPSGEAPPLADLASTSPARAGPGMLSELSLPASSVPPASAPGREPRSLDQFAPTRSQSVGADDADLGTASVIEPETFPFAILISAAALGMLAVLVLYRRVQGHRILEQATRLRVYEAIASNPGVRVGTLTTRLDLSYTTIKHHVRLLESCGLVVATPNGQRRLFANGHTANDQAQQAAIAGSSPAAKAILEHLKTSGPSDLPGLCASLGLPKSTASEALTRLGLAGLVAKRRAGKRLQIRTRSCLALKVRGPTSPSLQ